eukprot:8893612-Alexandrium_andersonii.AAC.1
MVVDGHAARLARGPVAGPSPKRHGMDFTYEGVVACTSRRLRRLLERHDGKTVHLCRTVPCEVEGDYALHC